jgi:hypothetical protein
MGDCTGLELKRSDGGVEWSLWFAFEMPSTFQGAVMSTVTYIGAVTVMRTYIG